MEIGNVTEYRIKSKDSYETQYTTKVLGALNPSATYEQVDATSRALMSLSSNTYDDTILVTEVSVNEELA